MATKSKIYIKPSKRGSLRKAMHAKEGEKLSIASMKKKMKNASPAMKKKLNFAINARKWKHDFGGPIDITNLDLGTSFAQMNNLPQARLSKSGLAPTNNLSGSSGIGMSFDPVSLGLNVLTSIGGALAEPMAMRRAEIYEDAAEDLRPVDINKTIKGSGFESFLRNPLTLGIGGRKKARLEAEQFNEKIADMQFNKDVKSRFSTMSQAPTYTPVARQGGFIAYKGQTHEGPDGGILVDKFGNPTAVSQEDSVASVEGGGKNKKGEVSYYDPETGSTYIYSDALKFAKPANDLLNKYKLNKPESLQYQQYKNDLLTKTMVNKKFENLRVAQEFAKETNTSTEDTLSMFKKGGELTSSKAKEILRDGTANGKKLTPKQKRYFGWVAGGRKAEGGELDKRTILMPKENLQYDRDLRMNTGWMDTLNKTANMDEFYNTNVGTWQGNPMTMKQFIEMPSYVTDYYNPNYAIEFNKNRLGLPNNFNTINTTPTSPSYKERYTPSYTVKPGNEVAYYRKGGYVPMYKNGKDGEEELTEYQKIFLKNYNFVERLFNPRRTRAKKLADPNQQLISHIGTTGFTIPQDRQEEYLEIPKAPIIKKPLENSKVIPPKTGGVGKPVIERKENILPNKVSTSNMNIQNIPLAVLVSGQIKQNLSGRPTWEIPEESNEYSSPWLNPAGHILSAAGSLAQYNALRKAKPENVSLGRVGAERISLAKQRLANIRNAATSRAMASSAARSSGMNAGVALSNTLAANTGANRLLGQENAKLLEQEETVNAQMRQQANMINAELAAQEGLFNTQQQNAYRMMMAQNNPLNNLARTAASYFADNSTYQQDYDTLQMLAPNAELYRDPNAKWKKNPFAKPKIRLR